jgi:hypothetical protein
MAGEEGTSTRFSLWVEKKKGVGTHLFSLRLKFCVKVSFWHQTCSSLTPLVCVKSQNCVLWAQWPEVNVKSLNVVVYWNFKQQRSGKIRVFFLGGLRVEGLGFRVKGCPFLH